MNKNTKTIENALPLHQTYTPSVSKNTNLKQIVIAMRNNQCLWIYIYIYIYSCPLYTRMLEWVIIHRYNTRPLCLSHFMMKHANTTEKQSSILWACDSYVHRWNWSSLVYVVNRRLFGDRLLAESIQTCCQLEPKSIHQWNIWTKTQNAWLWRNSILKCQNIGHFVQPFTA